MTEKRNSIKITPQCVNLDSHGLFSGLVIGSEHEAFIQIRKVWPEHDTGNIVPLAPPFSLIVTKLGNTTPGKCDHGQRSTNMVDHGQIMSDHARPWSEEIQQWFVVSDHSQP